MKNTFQNFDKARLISTILSKYLCWLTGRLW